MPLHDAGPLFPLDPAPPRRLPTRLPGAARWVGERDPGRAASGRGWGFPASLTVLPRRAGPSRALPAVASLRDGLRPPLTGRPVAECQRLSGSPQKDGHGGTSSRSGRISEPTGRLRPGAPDTGPMRRRSGAGDGLPARKDDRTALRSTRRAGSLRASPGLASGGRPGPIVVSGLTQETAVGARVLVRRVLDRLEAAGELRPGFDPVLETERLAALLGGLARKNADGPPDPGGFGGPSGGPGLEAHGC
ncbi:hypothetical protein Sros01_53960 [Streptomyces roseochromogenus]|nr:hypothetical protein Sros01_53960 [Streptomyces roseochromogenus]